MKFKGVFKKPGMTAGWVCSMAGVGECTDDRARWSGNGYWSDVCIRHMGIFMTNLNKKERNSWTGRKKTPQEE